MNGSRAFTLAEVLITLGIIGVVAALTIPTLLNSAKEKELEALHMKSKNIISNGYKLMMAKQDLFKTSELPFLSECYMMYDTECMSKAHKSIFQIVADSNAGLSASLLPDKYSISGETEKSPFKWENVSYIFATNDGMVYGVLPDDDITSFSVVSDVNGLKNPNTISKDMFKYRFAGNGVLTDVSFELEDLNPCSVDNPDACKSQASCMRAGDDGSMGIDKSGNCVSAYWDNNKCSVMPVASWYCGIE